MVNGRAFGNGWVDTIVQMRALPIQVEQSALTTFVDTKMALLTPIPEVKIASLSWLHPEDDQELSLALLAPEDGADFDLTIEVEVLCCVCDHPLNSLETKLSWSGPKRGRSLPTNALASWCEMPRTSGSARAFTACPQ